MVVSANLLPNGRQQFSDGNGKPYAGGSVFFYVPTTTTFKNTWSDPEKSSLNTNPVLLDANGEAVIFGDGEYRQILKDVNGNQIWDQISIQYVTVGGDLSGTLPNPTVNPDLFINQFDTNKNPPVDADRFLALDSGNALAPIYFLWSQIKSAMQTALQAIFDLRYAQSTNIGLGYSNLSITVTSDTQVNIKVDKIVGFNSSNAAFVGNGLNLTANISASGANGLDTGAAAISTWYYVWAIYNSTSNTWASLLSASATAPTMPSGYTYKVRVGAIRNDAAGKLIRTLQYGNTVQVVLGVNPASALLAMIVGSSGAPYTPTWTAVPVAAFVPTTAFAIKMIMLGSVDGVVVAPNNHYGALNSTTAPPFSGLDGDTNPGGELSVTMILEGANVYYAAASGGGLYAVGWIDNL